MSQRYDLELLAKKVMQERGLLPEFSNEVYQELELIRAPSKTDGKSEDLRSILWCSIDNDDSLDLDQLTFAMKEKDGKQTFFVAVADVSTLVHRKSAIDDHAKINTTSVYTPAKIFPMLPEKLSTNLTSLNEGEDRLAICIKMTVDSEMKLIESSIFEALVHNHAKLTYNSVGKWLEGKGEIPPKVRMLPGLEEALQLQHSMAQILKKRRHSYGALTLQSSKVEAKVPEDKDVCLECTPVDYAHELIEHFMIAANSVMANFFRKNRIASFRRVVRTPLRWDKIVQIARDLNETLPDTPDSKALDQFLIKRREKDPDTFQDLSLTIIKLLGRGEYVVEVPGETPIGHFGLALSEYTHSTAPNRRFVDLISQRVCKAFLRKESGPYSVSELEKLAFHCTKQEDAANKVERHLNKSAAAMYLFSHIGEVYQGIITGASEKGTWVRIFQPPVEGKLIRGFSKLDVGDRVTVKLISVDIPKGFIDFARD